MNKIAWISNVSYGTHRVIVTVVKGRQMVGSSKHVTESAAIGWIELNHPTAEIKHVKTEMDKAKAA